ncbi:MAG: PilZ domain-containing protein [Thermodesulfobacteriota bacterium]|nr:PilZ domain-containing protein [Thermodesulfobacteriota bacterium]
MIKKRKIRCIERRKFKRLDFSIPVTVQLLGTTKYPKTIHAETKNISQEGLAIELKVTLKNGSLLVQEGEEPIKLIPYLVLNEKKLKLRVKIPPKGDEIKAIAEVAWYDFGSKGELYYFSAGVFLEEMESEDRKKWENFVKSLS